MIDHDKLVKICEARNALCGFCQKSDCENCQVTVIVNDAFQDVDEAFESFESYM